MGMLEVVERGINWGQFIRLRKAYISNLRLLLSLEPFKKFIVVVVVVESDFSVKLWPKPSYAAESGPSLNKTETYDSFPSHKFSQNALFIIIKCSLGR